MFDQAHAPAGAQRRASGGAPTLWATSTTQAKPQSEASPRSSRRSWWARRRREHPRVLEPPCGGCERRGATPFDLYCRTEAGQDAESHFLPLSQAPRSRIALAVGAGVVLGALALWSAALASAVPLLVCGGLAGGLLLALALRFFDASRLLALTGWLILVATCAVWAEGVFSARVRALIVLALVLAAALALIATLVIPEASRPDIDAPARLLACLLGSAFASAIVLLVLQLDSGAAGAETSSVMLLLPLGLGFSSLAVLVLSGLAHGIRTVEHNPPMVWPTRLSPPLPPRRLPAPRAPAHSALQRLGSAMFVVGIRIAAMALNARAGLLRFLWWLMNLTIAATALGKHTILVWLTRARMLLVLALAEARRQLLLAVRATAAAIADWASTFLLALAVLLAAGAATVSACVLFESYLTGGSLWRGPVALALLALAATVLTLLWHALTKWPLAVIAGSAQHSSERGAPTVFLGLVLIGWFDGLLGLLGAGPIRPGLLTIAGTAILAVTAYIYRPSRLSPSEQSSAGS